MHWNSDKGIRAADTLDHRLEFGLRDGRSKHLHRLSEDGLLLGSTVRIAERERRDLGQFKMLQNFRAVLVEAIVNRKRLHLTIKGAVRTERGLDQIPKSDGRGKLKTKL